VRTLNFVSITNAIYWTVLSFEFFFLCKKRIVLILTRSFYDAKVHKSQKRLNHLNKVENIASCSRRDIKRSILNSETDVPGSIPTKALQFVRKGIKIKVLKRSNKVRTAPEILKEGFDKGSIQVANFTDFFSKFDCYY